MKISMLVSINTAKSMICIRPGEPSLFQTFTVRFRRAHLVRRATVCMLSRQEVPFRHLRRLRRLDALRPIACRVRAEQPNRQPLSSQTRPARRRRQPLRDFFVGLTTFTRDPSRISGAARRGWRQNRRLLPQFSAPLSVRFSGPSSHCFRLPDRKNLRLAGGCPANCAPIRTRAPSAHRKYIYVASSPLTVCCTLRITSYLYMRHI